MSLAPALAFLTDLAANNHTEWFRANRPAYEAARDAFRAFVRDVHRELAETDPHLRDVDPAKALFRINRDIRFSRDKAPYKRNFSAALAPGGPKDPGPIYYLHLEPGGASGLAGGIWLPDKEPLKQIRQEIDYNAPALRAILDTPEFTATFSRSFFAGEQLKRIPSGYAADHPEADLLRLKSFTVWHPVSDAQAAATDFATTAIGALRHLTALNNWLRQATHG